MPAGAEPPHKPRRLPEPFRLRDLARGHHRHGPGHRRAGPPSAPVLDDHLPELRDAGFRRLILDLRGLEFMDSTGLRLILDYDSQARNNGFSIALIRGPSAVQRIFDLTGTTAQLPFVDG
jgi:anti-anti-sigma factor